MGCEVGKLAAVVRHAGACTNSRHDTRLVVEPGTPDATAVPLAIREWIVPVLVREYLAERAAATAYLTTVNTRKLDTGALGKEQRDNPATNQ